jgi:hypothetical protein
MVAMFELNRVRILTVDCRSAFSIRMRIIRYNTADLAILPGSFSGARREQGVRKRMHGV